jgi:hypothetical protein
LQNNLKSIVIINQSRVKKRNNSMCMLIFII